MTKEEAMEALSVLKIYDAQWLREAVDMAIEALEQEPSCRNARQVDLISRQEAIDALDKRFDDVPMELTTEILLLRKDLREVIPSAQPEERTNEHTETHACDLISRQAAIDALYNKGLSMTAWCELLAMKWSDIQKCIEQLPSTQPERKKGKWIIDNKEAGRIWHCHCSNCGKDPQDHIGGTENWWLVRLPKYCPNCGLPMRGDEE